LTNEHGSTQMDTPTKPLTLLRRDEVKRRTGLSTSGLYQLMKDGALPRPVKLTGGTVAWPEHEIEAFIQQRIAARDSKWQTFGEVASRVVKKVRVKP
jgi:prophage regulatory protein